MFHCNAMHSLLSSLLFCSPLPRVVRCVAASQSVAVVSPNEPLLCSLCVEWNPSKFASPRCSPFTHTHTHTPPSLPSSPTRSHHPSTRKQETSKGRQSQTKNPPFPPSLTRLCLKSTVYTLLEYAGLNTICR